MRMILSISVWSPNTFIFCNIWKRSMPSKFRSFGTYLCCCLVSSKASVPGSCSLCCCSALVFQSCFFSAIIYCVRKWAWDWKSRMLPELALISYISVIPPWLLPATENSSSREDLPMNDLFTPRWRASCKFYASIICERITYYWLF